MRSVIEISLIILTAISLFSCEDNFSPNGKFRQQYALNSIIRNDTTFQVATVLKSFPLNGDDEYNKNFIDSVFLRLWQDEEVYVFKDSSVILEDSLGEEREFHYYYLDNFTPKDQRLIEIEALLPNGRRLYSSTVYPERIQIFSSGTDNEIPPEDGTFNAQWSNSGRYMVSDLKVKLYYAVNNQRKSIELPLDFVENGEKTVPYYPVPGRYKSFSIKMSVLDRIMESLSEEVEIRENIRIRHIGVEILVYDKGLSSYYSSIADLQDNFSVRVDQPEYTNVEGGLGIFGALVKKSFLVFIKPSYINSFGYEAASLQP